MAKHRPTTFIIFAFFLAAQCKQYVESSESIMKVENFKYPSIMQIDTLKQDIGNLGQNEELTSAFWTKKAQNTLMEHLKETKEMEMRRKLGHGQRAKSAVLVVGGGMSVTTVRAARELLSQQHKKESSLSFEKFPVVGLAQTYCIDAQVGDEACTAAAYLGGRQGYRDSVGGLPLSQKCSESDEGVDTILQWALEAGKDVGIVTTSSLTHPSVAAGYGQWHPSQRKPSHCPDLAEQLINKSPGKKFKIIFGGGMEDFLPNGTSSGRRLDNKDLVQEWKKRPKHHFITNRVELLNTVEDHPDDQVLGIFAPSDMEYHLLADDERQTSLKDMTEVAIKVLSRNKKGFFLFVFGGGIQRAHSENMVRLALDETIELSKAMASAMEMTSSTDTLLITTANHGSTLTVAGYPGRWDNVLGEVWNSKSQMDNMTYLGLSYAAGPGFRQRDQRGLRQNYAEDQLYKNHDVKFRYPANFPVDADKTSAGGEDVALFAQGPSQGLFSGVSHMSMVPHLMAHVLCVGPRLQECPGHTTTSSAEVNKMNQHLVYWTTLLLILGKIKMLH